MDAATATRLAQVLGREVAAARSLGGQHGVRHYRLELGDGTAAFAKVHNPVPDRNGAAGLTTSDEAAAAQAAADPDPAGFAAEAAGLRWLAAAKSVPVPVVLGCDASCLVIEWVDDGVPGPDAAARFGRELAGMHAAGPGRFGAPWPGVIAGLVLPNADGRRLGGLVHGEPGAAVRPDRQGRGEPEQRGRRADRVRVRAVARS